MKKRKFPGRKPGSKTVTKEERDGIIADYRAGMPLPDLVAKYKRSKSTIWGTARRAGIPFRRPGKIEPKKFEPKRGSKFVTDDERARIASDYRDGMVQAAMIAKYGRSKDAILRAVTMSGVPLRGRGHMKGKKFMNGKTKSKKKNKGTAMAASIKHANKALAKVHKNGDIVGRAVGVLIKTLEHEEIQEIFIDFNLKQYKTTRLRVEEGRVV